MAGASFRISGDPYHLGFQHGHLLTDEILRAIAAKKLHVEKVCKRNWQFFRDTAMTLYWPRIPEEFREEMEGIAEGVKVKGVSDIDLSDIVALNGFEDTLSYHHWLRGKEVPAVPQTAREDHCSAFIATGDATRDGGILVAHNTWSSYLTGTSNIIMDLSPAKGKRFLMQTGPGVISSGTDWFVATSGLVVTETTISGMKTFNPDATPYFIRARKAVQYGNSIDEWIKLMVADNNGGYANEWLLGDVRTSEIARLELGTFNYSIDRTLDGAFAGSNVARSEKVRLETKFNYNEPGSCTARRQRWDELIKSNRSRLNVEMAKSFLADHHDAVSGENSPNRNTLCGHLDLDGRGAPEWEVGPYCPIGAHDGKVTTSELASKGEFWAHWGKPCGMDFNSASFLSLHPEYGWQQSQLRDIKACPWTLFQGPGWNLN
ncbi:MAG TPA: C45 family peptidase [Candidatus Acidoferrales bacterium]|nr:C45 family peptidase [Candidatus Acidoferrales bacterium]